MNIERVQIIGGPGSGKTYLSMSLARRMRVEPTDLDDLFWDTTICGYGVPAEQERRDAALASVLQRERWVIEGVYWRWVLPAPDLADVIIVLTPSRWLRCYRILRRFLLRKVGLARTKRESLHDLLKLLVWNHRYDSDVLSVFLHESERLVPKLITRRRADEALSALLNLRRLL